MTPNLSTKIITLAMGLALVTSEPAISANDLPTDTEIKQSYLEHAALAQFFRWYQYYERTEAGLDNAVDILASDVVVKSMSGTANGVEEYTARVQKIPTSWKNAHFVKDVDVAVGEDGNLTLEASVTYLNEGMRDDGKVQAADLAYTTELARSEDLLPEFTAIEIKAVGALEDMSFEDAYAENRAKSVVHYWLALIEDPARDPEPVREILAEDFSLNFSSGAITDFDGFKAWLAGPASSVAASTHKITEFSTKATDDTRMSVEITFDWVGILPNGTKLTAQTRHDWTLSNDVSERFARIENVDVEVLKPFRPVKSE